MTESTTHVHGLIDAQVHNYSPECGGCYNRDLVPLSSTVTTVVNIEVVNRVICYQLSQYSLSHSHREN